MWRCTTNVADKCLPNIRNRANQSAITVPFIRSCRFLFSRFLRCHLVNTRPTGHRAAARFVLIVTVTLGRRFSAALFPRLFRTNPRSHHKGATGRVRTGNQRLPVLCHCQLGQDIPTGCVICCLTDSDGLRGCRWKAGPLSGGP